MRNIWRAVEELVNTVTAESSYNGESVGSCVGFDNFAEFSVLHARFHCSNCLF